MKKKIHKNMRVFTKTHSEMKREVNRRKKVQYINLPLLLDEMWSSYKANPNE